MPSQPQFEQFHQLFKQVSQLYSEAQPDDSELHRLVVAFINSLFWDYSQPVVIDDMIDYFMIDLCISQHLTMIADYHRDKKRSFSADKLILQQSLAALVCFGQNDTFPYSDLLIPFQLICTIRQSNFDITVFESDEESQPQIFDVDTIRRLVEHRFAYLNREQRLGRIISEREYRNLVNELVELIAIGELPLHIERLQQRSNGALISGYSCEFFTYGVYLLSQRYQIPRNVWLTYLSRKLNRAQSVLSKKFSRKPDLWNERIISE